MQEFKVIRVAVGTVGLKPRGPDDLIVVIGGGATCWPTPSSGVVHGFFRGHQAPRLCTTDGRKRSEPSCPDVGCSGQ